MISFYEREGRTENMKLNPIFYEHGATKNVLLNYVNILKSLVIYKIEFEFQRATQAKIAL